ncbi:hypothetical protein AB6A40_009352 [Gnathostoma spinigerum]|uniref:Uncharacterized protein n=1 Tax=Gnathostoma spinigerum TaxID=75299 RepID=A0ABD6ERS0_9BILA
MNRSSKCSSNIILYNLSRSDDSAGLDYSSRNQSGCESFYRVVPGVIVSFGFYVCPAFAGFFCYMLQASSYSTSGRLRIWSSGHPTPEGLRYVHLNHFTSIINPLVMVIHPVFFMIFPFI